MSAVSVALSQKGVKNFITLLQSSILSGLNNTSLPLKTFNDGWTIPSLGVSTYVQSIEVSNGTANLTGVSISDVTQQSGGKFKIQVVASPNVQYSSWHEKGSITIPPAAPGGFPSTSYYDRTWSDFRFTATNLTVSLTVQISLGNNGQLVLTIVDKSSSVGSLDNLNIPSGSGLNGSIFGCITDKVKDTMRDLLQNNIDYATPVAGAVQPILNNIPSSGQIAPDVTFHFPGSNLQFPNDSGVQFSASGLITWKTTNYPGVIPTVPSAPVVSTKDGNFYVSTYEFNALGWAAYNAGWLNATFHKNDLPVPDYLTVDYYGQNAPQLFEPFAKKYPGKDMYVTITAKQAPSFIVQKDVIPVNHFFDWKIYVDGVTDPVLEFELNETDNLSKFAVGTSSDDASTQLLKFDFKSIRSNAKLVKLNMPLPEGQDPTSFFQMAWAFVFRGAYGNTLAQVGQRGVALPSSLNSLFINWDISLLDGYAAVNVDFRTKPAANSRVLLFTLPPNSAKHPQQIVSNYDICKQLRVRSLAARA